MAADSDLRSAPTLRTIERSRSELLTVCLILVMALSAGMVLISFAQELPSWVRAFGGTINAVRVSLLVACAAFAAYAIDKEGRLRRLGRKVFNERARAAALTEQLTQAVRLSEASKAVLSCLDPDDTLNAALTAAVELVGADEGSITLVEDEELVAGVSFGGAGLAPGERCSLLDGGLVGYVARTRQPLLMQDVDAVAYANELEGRGIVSTASLPLVAGEHLLGILSVSVTKGERRFSEYDLEALSRFGEHAALAIRHSRPLRQARDAYARLAAAEGVEWPA